jgi:hypothetical protein
MGNSRDTWRQMVTNAARIGPRFAPATVVVVAEPGCDGCKNLSATLLQLRSRFPQHLAVVWRPLQREPSDSGVTAGSLMFCMAAGQEAANEADVALSFPMPVHVSAESLLSHARSALRTRKVTECVRSPEARRSDSVTAAVAENRASVAGPRVLLNGLEVDHRTSLASWLTLVASQFAGREKS